MAIELNHSHLTRQLDLIPVGVLSTPITIIGAGAIGSFAALQLVKMGFTELEVWDYDKVSVENMSCQFYRHRDIGTHKVIALENLIEEFTGESIETVGGKFDPADKNQVAVLRSIVINAVDDMGVRKAVFNAIRESGFQVNWLIDPRMGAEDCLLYCMNPHDEKDATAYSKTHYSNEDAVQERCTAKATIYTANLLSGLVAKTVKNLACGEEYPRVSQWSIKHNDLKSWKGTNAKANL